MRVSTVKRVNLIGALIDCQSRHNNFVCLNILQKWEDSDYRMARFTDREKEVLYMCCELWVSYMQNHNSGNKHAFVLLAILQLNSTDMLAKDIISDM